MAILIGVDEAGYGPHLGPLVVAATAWRVAPRWRDANGRFTPRLCRGVEAGKRRRNGAGPLVAVKTPGRRPALRGIDLYALLSEAVARSPCEGDARLAIADSKALYKSGLGVRQLERGVLAALALVSGRPTPSAMLEACATTRQLIELTGADSRQLRREAAWHFDDEQSLPLEEAVDAVLELAQLLQRTCDANGVGLAALRARFVFPAEFNALVEYFGNKGSALSHVTLALVREVVDALADDEATPIYIYLDKHGGRNRYAALVQHHFPDSWVRAAAEGRRESRYVWEHNGCGVEAVFRVGCEELLPTALASMTAKYHRELAMRAFNAFWAERVPGLRPTAGYFGDSRRFKAEIDAMQRELGIEDRVLWRCR